METHAAVRSRPAKRGSVNGVYEAMRRWVIRGREEQVVRARTTDADKERLTRLLDERGEDILLALEEGADDVYTTRIYFTMIPVLRDYQSSTTITPDLMRILRKWSSDKVNGHVIIEGDTRGAGLFFELVEFKHDA